MQMQRITNADALEQLAQVEPRTCTEFPRFIAAPEAIRTIINASGEITVTYACLDSANDRTWVTSVNFGPPLPVVTERLRECEVEALATIDKHAKAVWN